MNADELAQRIMRRVQTAAPVNEPSLVIDGKPYTTAQIGRIRRDLPPVVSSYADAFQSAHEAAGVWMMLLDEPASPELSVEVRVPSGRPAAVVNWSGDEMFAAPVNGVLPTWEQVMMGAGATDDSDQWA